MLRFPPSSRYLAAVAVLAATLTAATTAALTPADLFDRKLVGVSDLSPDGRWLIYTSMAWDTSADAMQRTCLRRDLDTGHEEVLFEPGDGAWGAVFRPDGKAIAFLKRGGEGLMLMRASADGGKQRIVTPLQGVQRSASGLQWSPDGEWIAFTASALVGRYDGDEDVTVAETIGYRHLEDGYREGKLAQIFIVEVRTGEVTRLTKRFAARKLDVRALSWSPDGRHLVFEAKAKKNLGRNLDSNLWVIDRDGGSPKRLTTNPGRDEQPVWLDDGRIAWRRGTEPLAEAAPCAIAVAELNRDGTALTEPTLLATGFDNLFWRFRPAGEHFVYTGFIEGCMDVVTTDGDRRLTEGGHDFWSMHCAGGRVILGGASQTCPSAIYRLDLTDDGRATGLSTVVNPNLGWSMRVGIREPQKMQVEVGGKTIDCWYVLPPGRDIGERVPTVLSIHGGPEWMYGGYFLPEFHVLPAAGYAVLWCNPTGSTGYGFEFQEGIIGDWLDTPASEVLAAVDRAVADGWADPDRLAVMGGSYGGYLACGLTVLCDRFKAAAADRISCDQAAFWGTTDEKWFPEHEFGGPPWGDARPVYDHHNLVLRAENANTPTLISQGMRDYRCLIAQAETWFSVLESRGVEARFLRFAKEGHGIRGTKNIVFYLEELLAFFDEHVVGAEAGE